MVVLSFFTSRRRTAPQSVNPGFIVIAIYALIILIVYGIGLTHLNSLPIEQSKTRVFLMMVAYIGVAVFAMVRVRTSRQFNFVLGFLAVGLVYNCAVGLLQSTMKVDLRLLFQPPGFVTNIAEEGRFAAPERFGSLRFAGTSSHPIEFSVLAAITVPLLVHLSRYAESKHVRFATALAVGVAIFAVPVGISRSGIAALVTALLVYMWNCTLRALMIAGLIGCLAMLAELAIAPATANALFLTIINSSSDDSVLERVSDYARVSQTVHEHPLFGLGLGATLPTEYGFLDNEWLQALSQGGLIGGFGILTLSLGGLFGVANALRGAGSSRERDRAYAVGAMFVGTLASSFTFDLFSFQQAALVFFLLFGLLWSNSTVLIQPVKLPTSAPGRPNL